jgi:solute:Na+ symporter, SSS family
MNPLLILTVIISYFLLLIIVSFFTSRNADNQSFFLGNRKSPWYVIAFGMLGASLSGVTFISVPGWVQTSDMSYIQMVLGFILGYFTIAHVLLPLYYRLNLTSIYSFLDQRFGFSSYKTGAAFFLLSRTIGSAFRLFIVANVLQIMIFDAWNIPFYLTVVITIALIYLYTFKGGIKTIIWTDALQTVFLLSAVIISIIIISRDLNFGFIDLVTSIKASKHSSIFEFSDWNSRHHFVKQFFAGAFITIVMTGLDQDMMQKNLSCRNLKDAQKNMITYGIAFLPANILFLSLGVLLGIYASNMGIDSELIKGDDLFPFLAANHLGPVVLIFFILGLIASAYSSADSALTALTTSFTIDIIGIKNKSEKQIHSLRKKVHILFAIILALVIIVFKLIDNKSVIDAIYTVAGYTYGPLLGLFAFGLFTKIQVRDKLVPLVAIASPLICLLINLIISASGSDYKMGYELLLLNGLITFMGLWIVSIKAKKISNSKV